MKKKVMAALLALCMVVTLLPSTALAAEEGETWAEAVMEKPTGYSVDTAEKTVTISNAEGLAWFAKEINSWESKAADEKVSFAGYTINITDDIDLSGKLWIPIDASTVKLIDVEEQQKIDRDQTYNNKLLAGAVINGNGHTISNMVVKNTVRGPHYDSTPGDGQNSYYYAGFIGRTTGDLTIHNLTFAGASVDAYNEQFVEEHGGSSMAVVLGYYGGGTLTLNNVTVSDCLVDGMQKVGGYVGQCSGAVTINKCAVVDSTFRSLYQCAPVIAYAMNSQYNNDDGTVPSKRANTLTINGVKLENNRVVIVKEEDVTYKTIGNNVDVWYYTKSGGYDLWLGNQADAVLIAQDRFSAISGTSDAVADKPLTMAAEVNGYQYAVLEDAVASIEGEGTITILNDVKLTETLVIPQGKKITLDLAGKTVINALNGVPTSEESDPYMGRIFHVEDGSALTVLGTAKGSRMQIAEDAVSNGFFTIDIGGSLTLNGGAYAGETSKFYYGEGQENYQGTMIHVLDRSGDTQKASAIVLNDLTVDSNHTFLDTDTIATGNELTVNVNGGNYQGTAAYLFHVDSFPKCPIHFKNVTATVDGPKPVVEISGSDGTFDDCIFKVVKPNDNNYSDSAVFVGYDGIATINSGTYEAGGTALYIGSTGGRIVVNSGTFKGVKHAVKADASGSYVSEVEIVDGDFNGDLAVGGNGTKRISISGGYFTTDPSEYLKEGKAAIPSDKSGYAFTVGTKAETEVKTAVGAPVVDTSKLSADLGDAIETVAAVSQSVEADTAVLTAAANAVLDKADSQAEAAKAALTADSDLTPPAGADPHVYAQTYLNIIPTGYDADTKTATLDIQPMYRVVASYVDLSDPNNETELAVKGDVGVEIPNAVVLENSETALTEITTIAMTVDLPTGFTAQADTTYYAKHIHNGKTYYYQLTIDNNQATFTNPNGFSEFVLPVALTPAASIGSVFYETFQAAVTDAKDGETITVLDAAADLSASMSGSSRTITVENGAGSEITVKVGSKTETLIDGDSAAFQYIRSTGGSVEYTIVLGTKIENGTILVSAEKASVGKTITITATADNGYEVQKITAKDAAGRELHLTNKGNGTYTFSMPSSNVTITASFQAKTILELPFQDVTETNWYYDAVCYVYESGLMQGNGENTFLPNGTLSRGMLAQILYNRENKPITEETDVFSDVAAGVWYADAVHWAVEQHIVDGYGNGRFGPNDPVTREQMVTILYRYAKYKGYDTEDGGMAIREFADEEQVSNWAKDAVIWAIQTELLEGDGNGYLHPAGTATRSQAAQILMNFCQLAAL